MMLFSDFVDAKYHYKVSVSYTYTVIFLMAINFMYMGYNFVCRAVLSFTKYRLRKLWLEHVK